jgi:hypothetical protein
MDPEFNEAKDYWFDRIDGMDLNDINEEFIKRLSRRNANALIFVLAFRLLDGKRELLDAEEEIESFRHYRR